MRAALRGFLAGVVCCIGWEGKRDDGLMGSSPSGMKSLCVHSNVKNACLFFLETFVMSAGGKMLMFQGMILLGLLIAAVGVFMETNILSKDCKVASMSRIFQIVGAGLIGFGFILMLTILSIRVGQNSGMAKLANLIIIVHAIAVVVLALMELDEPKDKDNILTKIRLGLLALLALLSSFVLFVRSTIYETYSD